MVEYVFNIRGLLLALLCAALGSTSASARPPDLPVAIEQECQPEGEIGVQFSAQPAATGFIFPDPSGNTGIGIIGLQSRIEGSDACEPSKPSLLQWLWQDVVQLLHGDCPQPLNACRIYRLMQALQTNPNCVIPVCVPDGGTVVDGGLVYSAPPCSTMVPHCGTMPACPTGHPGCTSATMTPRPLAFPVPMMPPGCPMAMMPPHMTPPGCPIHVDLPPLPEMNNGLVVQTPESLQQLAEGRKLYEIAEYYLKTGHLLSAHFYFQLIHLHSPLSPYGQAAEQKMTLIENQILTTRLPGQMGQPVKPEQAGGDSESSNTVSNRTPTEDENFLHQLTQAQEMFHQGERCRTRGDLDQAYECYQETQRLCPESDYARLAAKQMRTIDVLRQMEALTEDKNAESNPAAESREQTELMDWQQVLPWFLPLIPDLFGVYDNAVRPESNVPGIIQSGPGPVLQNEGNFDVNLGILNLRLVKRSIEDEQVDLAQAVEMSAWLAQTVNLLSGGNTRVDLDVNNSAESGLRIRGGIYFGGLGCQVIREAENWRVIWPAVPE